jgi:hypothetical protein
MRKILSEDGFEIEVYDLDGNFVASFNSLEEADDFVYNYEFGTN